MIELLFLMPELKIISYSEFLSRYVFKHVTTRNPRIYCTVDSLLLVCVCSSFPLL